MWRSIQLDPTSQTPLYRQLFFKIRQFIRDGALRQGDRLPATRELAGSLGLNRATVAAAYDLLAAEGLIRAHVGRGSFVVGAEVTPHLPWEQLLPPLDPLALPAGSVGAAISFATSRPSEDLFPLETLRGIAEELLGLPQAASLLQLGSPAGYPPLRQYILEQARAQGWARPSDDVVITSGCQQALDLLVRVLLRPGDAALVEDPVYPGLKNLLLSAGIQPVGVPVGAEGLDLEAAGRALERYKPRVMVVTPSFQNPTGATLSLSAREALLRLARTARLVLIENDVYSELRYEGAALPRLKQLDASGDTVLAGSFSKIAFPGLRVGWVIGPKPLAARLAQAKQLCDLHTDQLSQALLWRFAQQGGLEAHLQRVRAAGAERLRALVTAVEKHFPSGTFYRRPVGGMNLWLRLPEPLDAAELLPRARREGVTYLPGSLFEVSRRYPQALRLCFAGLKPEQIQRGAEILGRVFAAAWEEARAADRYEPAPAVV